jgi:hypothetical protein
MLSAPLPCPLASSPSSAMALALCEELALASAAGWTVRSSAVKLCDVGSLVDYLKAYYDGKMSRWCRRVRPADFLIQYRQAPVRSSEIISQISQLVSNIFLLKKQSTVLSANQISPSEQAGVS